MNVTFDEISVMAFEQRRSKPGLKGMTSGQINSGLDLSYAPSTIKPTKHDLDLLFEAMYDDYIGGQPSATPRTILAAQAPQVLQTPTTSTTITDTAPTPINSSSQATHIPNTSQDVDELEPQQQHAQQQDNQAPLQPKTVADNVLNAMLDGNTFVNPFAPPSISASESSSLQYVDPSNMHTHVYKLKKALYGLKQAPRAWYDELSKFLLQNHFFKGTIDPTLFIRRFDDDILVVQVYVDDIIFGSTNPRPKLTEEALKEVKRIFCYLWGTINMGLWYTKDSGFELTRFLDADYAGCKDTFKSTSGGTQFLGEKLVSWSSKKQDCISDGGLPPYSSCGSISRPHAHGSHRQINSDKPSTMVQSFAISDVQALPQKNIIDKIAFQ
ncbi:retrovirus-related pol polyprotein from transposon TNT 1-94 [Tanacetum coccineum]